MDVSVDMDTKASHSIEGPKHPSAFQTKIEQTSQVLGAIAGWGPKKNYEPSGMRTHDDRLYPVVQTSPTKANETAHTGRGQLEADGAPPHAPVAHMSWTPKEMGVVRSAREDRTAESAPGSHGVRRAWTG